MPIAVIGLGCALPTDLFSGLGAAGIVSVRQVASADELGECTPELAGQVSIVQQSDEVFYCDGSAQRLVTLQVQLDGETVFSNATAAAASKDQCPDGGVQVGLGEDTDGNGQLDETELSSTGTACGAAAPAEEEAASDAEQEANPAPTSNDEGTSDATGEAPTDATDEGAAPSDESAPESSDPAEGAEEGSNSFVPADDRANGCAGGSTRVTVIVNGEVRTNDVRCN